DSHHPRPVVGVGPDRRGDGKPLDLVPPAVAVRPVASVRHRVAGGGRLPRDGDRTVFHPRRRAGGHRGSGGAGPALSPAPVTDLTVSPSARARPTVVAWH